MSRAAFVAVGLLLGGAADDGAREVLVRTKNTTATYASYQWMIVRDEEGNNEDGWAAEFHAGDWHRIENRWRRVLSNCRTGETYVYDISTGKTQRNDANVSSACGIDDAPRIEAVIRLPTVARSSVGELDTIRVTDNRNVRTYQVDSGGMIYRASWMPRNGSPAPCLDQESVAVLSTLPSRDIFTKGSLATEATPTRYQKRPVLPPVGLSGRRCGS